MDNFLGIPLTLYCERSGHELFAEPLNAISNIAFILAGFGIYKLLQKNKIYQAEYKGVILLIFLVGLGSFLWHTTRNQYTLFLDAIPAALSVALITYLLLSKLIGNKLFALLAVALLLPSRFLISSFAPTDFISSLIRNGINAAVFLVIIVCAFKKYGNIAFEGLIVLAIYLLAITMRTIDLEVCSTISVGTHFLWHIFNALAVYLAIKFLIKLERVKD